MTTSTPRQAEFTAPRPTPSRWVRLAAGGLRLTGRLLALGALLGLLVAVPLAATTWGRAMLPDPDRLRTAWRTGLIDDRVLLDIGAIVFAALWVWFTCSALGEIVRVLRWRIAVARQDRRGRRHGDGAHERTGADGRPEGTPPRRPVRLSSIPPSPVGWVRRLVRVALLSTTIATTSGLATGVAGVGAATWSTVSVAVLDDGASTDRAPDTRADLPAAGEAVAAAAPTRATGDGVVVQRIVSTGRETPYSLAVRAGDPALRDRIIEMHTGRTAPDGTVWTGGVFPEGMELDVPVEHVVVPGESYWSIAEDHLELQRAEPSPGEIAALTDVLVTSNAPEFRRSDPTLLLPGDVILLPAMADTPPTDVPVHGPPLPSPAGTPDDPTTDVDAEPMGGTTQVATSGAPVGVPGSLPVVPSGPGTGRAVDVAGPTPGPSTASAQVAPAGAGAPAAATSSTPAPARTRSTTFGGTVLLAAGALGLLESRRRHQLRHAPTGTDAPIPGPEAIAVERTLRALGASERVARLELALRSVGHLLTDSPRHPVAVRTDRCGRLDVVLDGPAPEPSLPWRAVADPVVWHLPADVPTVDLAATARRSGQPCPALVQLGSTEDGDDLFVDLEAIGVLRVVGPTPVSTAVVRALAASLAASPLAETVRLVTHGLDTDVHLGNLNAEAAATLDDALDAAVVSLGSTAVTAGSQRTFHLRASSGRDDGESWEPSVVVSTGWPGTGGDDEDEIGRDLVAELRGLGRRSGRGLAVVLADAPTGTSSAELAGVGWSITAGTDPTSGWSVAPLGVTVHPVGLSDLELADLAGLLEAADRPLPSIAAGSAAPHDRSIGSLRPPFEEPDWSLLVRVLGPVGVIDRVGRSVEFERGRALELLAWASLHRERPTRSAARTAMWEVDVRDATFTNVVSDARRSLARAVPPPPGEDWIARTMTDALSLHPLVRSDADLLRIRLEAAQGLPAEDAIDVLTPGLELVTDLPFAGTSYLWPDAEGITTSLILLVTGAAATLARHHLALGDVAGVFRATGQGLKVLAGHEELIGLRMRAHAQAGDLAGVRGEWDVYRRAVTADAWSGGDPSPKLVALHRELLGVPH